MSSLARSAALLLSLLASLGGERLAAQSDRDSLVALRTARQEQNRFESYRRRTLPWAWGSGSGDCDERIGRFCLTHEEETEYEVQVDPPGVVDARDDLVATLGELARRYPGDRWISGHRIRYLVEAKRFDEARAAAGECQGQAWWCAALSGFVAHFAGRAAEADSAFGVALSLIPVEDGERWTDITDLLPVELLRLYRRLPDTDRTRFQERFWALADPFYSRPGNELRSEHLVRNLFDELQDRAETPDNLSWGSDLREILIRYGWPRGWSRIRQNGTLYTTEIGFIGHYVDTDQDLLPPAEIFLDTAGITAGEWDLDSGYTRAGYAVPMADTIVRWFYPVENQIALFYRGDSALVVAAYDLPEDSVKEGSIVDAALVATLDGVDREAIARVPNAGRTRAVSLLAPARPLLVSLELVVEAEKRAGRVRTGLSAQPPQPGQIAVSDLLILRNDSILPDSLSAAVDLARGNTRVRSGEKVAVFWEVYGLSRQSAEELEISLRLVSGAKGWLRRFAERARIVRDIDPVRLRWTEGLPNGAIFARSLGLEIPEVSAGVYTLELTITAGNAEPVVAKQELVVE